MMTAIPKKGRNGTYIYRYRCQRHSRKHDHLNRSRCPNAQTMRVEAVEERTWEKLGNAIGNFEWLSEKIAEALEHTTRPEYEKQVAVCQKKISSLTKELDKLVSLQATEARKVILASLERTLDAKAKALEIEEATLAELEGLLAASRSQADLLADVRDRVSAMVGKDITFDDKVRIANALQVETIARLPGRISEQIGSGSRITW